MADREKVIKGLECCAVGAECDHCPYSMLNKTGYEGCYQMHVDALALVLALLKAQEPRVMTLEEMHRMHELNRTDQQPAWVEVKDGNGYWVIASPLGPGAGTHRSISTHGKTWRCWTSRPTEEQREATEWQT